MKKLASLLLCFALSLSAWADPPQGRELRRLRESRRTGERGPVGGAFFEFAPSSGAGMPAACSTTAPTGVKGEVLTFTRASSATCTKGVNGLRTTGIADGDLVVLSSGQPRVEYDADGVLGLLVESSRTNSCLRSEELDNAAWMLDGALTFGSQGTAPDGTTTADLLIDNAVTFEGVYQTITAAAGTYTCSGYLKGGTSTVPLIQLQDVGGTGTLQSATPTLSTTTWTRQALTITTAGGTTGYRTFIYPASTAGAQGTIYAWGWQCEAGAYATSYIPTTSATVTRAGESNTIAGSHFPTASYSIAASVTTEWGGSQAETGRAILEGQIGAASGAGFFFFASTVRAQNLTSGADNTLDVAWTPTAGTTYRLATANDGTNQAIYSAGTAIAGPTAKTHPDSPWATATGLGYGPAFGATLGPLNGIISRVCVDPNPTRCR